MKPHLPTQGHRRHDPRRHHFRRHRTRGAALMMTLIMLVLLSILITGFVVSMRTELTIAYANENIQRTKMVAQAAVSHGIDLLRSNIPEPADITVEIGDKSDSPARNWISNPGRLTVDLGSGSEQIVDLHTGSMHGGDDLTSFDLNQPLPGETAAAIVAVDSGPRPKMRVAWANILQDPSRAAGAPLDNGEINAITGRYAFWMDDETSKVNFNVASGKNIDAWKHLADGILVGNTAVPRGRVGTQGDYIFNLSYAIGHPATINLNHLFGEEGIVGEFAFDRGRLATHIYTNGWHQYPESILEYYNLDGDPEFIDPAEKDWYDENKWNLTFYSRSPEFNVFGRSRFFTIFNPLAIEGGPVYQMPFTADGVLHLHTLMGGLEHHPTEVEVNRQNINILLDYFGRDDWPGYQGSFENKWGGKKSAFQVAINIIQMGILASGNLYESDATPHKFAYNLATDLTDGTRNDVNKATYPERDLWRDQNGDLYLPQTLGPHLTEVHFDFLVEPHSDPAKFVTEFYNGAGELDGILYKYHIAFKYSTEYFMHNHGWVVPTLGNSTNSTVSGQISPFPTAVDFLRVRTFPTDNLNYRPDDDHNGGDVDKAIVMAWRPSVPGIPSDVNIRGTRNAVFQSNWQTLTHRELMIDIAEDASPGVSKNIFTIGPLYPTRTGDGKSPAIPGLSGSKKEGEADNIKVAESGKFYLPSSAGSGPSSGNFASGFMTEAEVTAAQAADAAPPHPFMVFVDFEPESQNILGTYGEQVEIRMDTRLGLAAPDSNFKKDEARAILRRPKELLPMGDSPAGGAATSNLEGNPDHVLQHRITFDDLRTEDHRGFSWRVQVEPRVALKQEHWLLVGDKGFENNDDADSIDSRVDFEYNLPEQSKFRHLQVGWSPNNTTGDMLRLRYNDNKTAGKLTNQRPQRGTVPYSETYRFTSPGYYSLIHTGQQEGEEFRSLSLLPESEEDSSYGQGPPDYVLFDLFAPSFCFDAEQWRNSRRLPDNWSTISYMNSTAGQINLNSRIYPDDAGEDFNPPARLKPLEAVFVHLRNVGSSTQQWGIDFAASIDEYQQSKPFAYVGELAEVPGYTDGTAKNDQFRREEILRNMMGCLTTKSNTFGMWGVAQTVRKSPSNLQTSPERFEEGDQVLGEKRFFALIERYIWTGRDGAPGNAHVDANGIWDRLAEPRQREEGQIQSGSFVDTLHDIPGAPPNVNPNTNTTGSGISFAQMDGPNRIDMDGDAKLALADVIHTVSTLEEAYNPPHPVMKYRVVYLKYLDQ